MRPARAALTRLYANSVQADAVVIHDGIAAKGMLASQLDWVMPLRSEMVAIGRTAKLEDFALGLDERSKVMPLLSAIFRVGLTFGMDRQTALQFFRMAAWRGMTDINLARPVQMNRFMERGGKKLRAELQSKLLGRVIV